MHNVGDDSDNVYMLSIGANEVLFLVVMPTAAAHTVYPLTPVQRRDRTQRIICASRHILNTFKTTSVCRAQVRLWPEQIPANKPLRAHLGLPAQDPRICSMAKRYHWPCVGSPHLASRKPKRCFIENNKV